MSDDTVLRAEISDAYAFVSGLKMANDFLCSVNLRFSPFGIRLTREAKSAQCKVLFDLEMDQKKLLSYKYNAYDDKGELVDEISVGFDISKFVSVLKTVKRKTAITLMMKAGDSNLYIYTSGDNNGSFIIETKNVDETTYALDEYKKQSPICKVIPEDFSTSMAKLRDGKCKQIEFQGYKEGILVRGYDSSSKAVVVDNFGSIPDEVTEEKVMSKKKPKFNIVSSSDAACLSFDGAIVATLAKINKVCGRAVVGLNIFKEKEGSMVSIETQFGCFGSFYVFIRAGK